MCLIVDSDCVTFDCSPGISVSSGQAMSRFEDVGYQAKFDIIEARGGLARVQVMCVCVSILMTTHESKLSGRL